MKLSKELHKLETLFDELNKHFFDGDLSSPIITLHEGKKLNNLGHCTVDGTWLSRQEGWFYEINISPNCLSKPLSKVAETMLHEMIHLYIVSKKLAKAPHGRKFKECAESHGLVCSPNDYKCTKFSGSAAEWIERFASVEFEIYRTDGVGILCESC